MLFVLVLQGFVLRRLDARAAAIAAESDRAAKALRDIVAGQLRRFDVKLDARLDARAAELRDVVAVLRLALGTLERLILASVHEPPPEPTSSPRSVPDLPPVELPDDDREAAPPSLFTADDESDEEVTMVGPGVVVALGAPQVLQALREFERACDVAELAKETRVKGLLKLGTLADVQGAIAEVQAMVTESGERDAAAIGGLLASRVIQRKRASARRSTIRPPAPAPRHIPEPA